MPVSGHMGMTDEGGSDRHTALTDHINIHGKPPNKRPDLVYLNPPLTP